MIYLLSPLKKEGTISLPMISFELVTNIIDFSYIDTLMFTSKQAVVSANAIDNNWKKYPSIAIGSATKKKIEELGGEVIYNPKDFYGKSWYLYFSINKRLKQFLVYKGSIAINGVSLTIAKVLSDSFLIFLEIGSLSQDFYPDTTSQHLSAFL